MSEKITHHEHEKSHEKLVSSAEQKETLKRTMEAGKHAENGPKDSIESIRDSIEHEAAPVDEQAASGNRENQSASEEPAFINRTVKNSAYTKELRKIRTHLRKPEKSFSKVIHNKTVETISEVSSKTIARPSGLLGGGIAAFVGSMGLLWVSRHYGFTYNYFVFILFLVGGYLVGMILELFVRSLRKR